MARIAQFLELVEMGTTPWLMGLLIDIFLILIFLSDFRAVAVYFSILKNMVRRSIKKCCTIYIHVYRAGLYVTFYLGTGNKFSLLHIDVSIKLTMTIHLHIQDNLI